MNLTLVLLSLHPIITWVETFAISGDILLSLIYFSIRTP